MIEILEENIPVSVYQHLRSACGLSAKSNSAAEVGLANTLYSIVVKNELNEYIGMGRVIGDGGCFCQVVDICILPEYQRKGLGKNIMKKIKAYIDNELPESCYISLLADGKASILYEQFGFRDTLPNSKGMYQKVASII